jgi:hypothetical protein
MKRTKNVTDFIDFTLDILDQVGMPKAAYEAMNRFIYSNFSVADRVRIHSAHGAPVFMNGMVYLDRSAMNRIEQSKLSS